MSASWAGMRMGQTGSCCQTNDQNTGAEMSAGTEGPNHSLPMIFWMIFWMICWMVFWMICFLTCFAVVVFSFELFGPAGSLQASNEDEC